MIPVPTPVKNSIRNHIQSSCSRGEEGWESAKQDEDTITGDFFGNLRNGWTKTADHSWRLVYNKFRGRGPNALEKEIGADGIITIHYTDSRKGVEYYKSLIFQAKKEGRSVDKEQLRKMRQFFPGGNMVIIYGPRGYSAYEAAPANSLRLCDIITNNFLNCTIGIEGLYYDSSTDNLIRPTSPPISATVDNELIMEISKDRR
jgi:hypothetical protein